MRSHFPRSQFSFPAFALLAFAIALGACTSLPDSEPEANGAKEGAAAEPEENLLSSGERSQLYFDLDQYTSRYMSARDEGNSRAWMSLHASVLMPMVERNLRELLRTAKSKDEPRYRVIAVRALGFGSDLSGSRISPVLVAQLSEADVNIVNSALVSLYMLGWPETPVEPIVKKLNHQDSLIRSSGALALSRIVRRARQKAGDDWKMTPALREASGRLMEMAHRPEEDAFVRAHAAAALGAIGDPASADILINLLLDEQMVVRVRAAQSLAAIGQENSIQPLIEALGVAESRAESRIVVASLEKIAVSLGHPMDKEALGLDPEKWRAWYEAVKSGK